MASSFSKYLQTHPKNNKKTTKITKNLSLKSSDATKELQPVGVRAPLTPQRPCRGPEVRAGWRGHAAAVLLLDGHQGATATEPGVVAIGSGLWPIA